jgi:hypothetical protein
MSSNQSTTKSVIGCGEWNTAAIKYMPPKINKIGGKSITLISKQTNRSLHISTPLMMTWGISDFTDEKGESDGKYSISLNFPNDEYKTKTTDDFLQKLKDFENQILDDAVRNSELWWGEDMSREVVKHTFFPFLKYSKNKDTKKVDYSRPPSIRAKVPFYDGKWGLEIYNTASELIFPCDNDMLSPVDFVQKLSNVACVLQCSGIWIGGKGWGLTWKLIQCVVKPREVISVYGKCHIQLSVDDVDKMDKPMVTKEVLADAEEEVIDAVSNTPAVTSTEVDDSDEETEPIENDASVPEPEPEPEPVPVPPPVKKVIKKALPVDESVVVEPVVPESTGTVEAPKKKVVKKKV